MSLKHLLQCVTRTKGPRSRNILSAIPDGSLSELQSNFFSHYDFLLRRKLNFSKVEEPLGHFIPRLDYYLSCKIGSEQMPNSKPTLSKYFEGALLEFLLLLHDRGLFWRYGRTVNLNKYCLYFPILKLRYVWIPKTACTTIKTELLKRTDPEFLVGIECGSFHESITARYGATVDDLADASLHEISLVRHPIERLVSCYVDKFVNPILERRCFEDFAYDHLLRIYALFNIDADPGARSASFAEFLSYIVSQPPWSYDAHWRPQSHFLGNYAERLLYRVENVGRLLRDLPLHHDGNPPYLNISTGLKLNEGAPLTGRLFAKTPAEFQKSDIESYNDFLPKSIYWELETWLEEDLDLFENAF